MFIRGRYLILGLVLTILVTSGFTFVATNLLDKTPLAEQSVTGLDNQFAKFKSTYDTLSQDFYQDVDQEKLLNGAIDGMIKALDDPYSTYMSPDEAASFNENIESSFEGIGAEIKEEDGKIVVEVPIKGSPAEKAGVKPKDKILKVDGKSLEGMKVTEAVKHIRGQAGSKAELIIERAGEPSTLAITVIRDKIPLETVRAELLADGMGKVVITQFSETTAEEFNKAVDELKGKGMKGLILDLRQNPGGLLDAAVDIGNRLIPDNKLILQVEYRDGEKKTFRSSATKSEFPLVVLADGGSASASEILIGALKESAKVPVIGEKTFGKGTVQTTHGFKDGSNIKYTTAKWLTPDGNWVHKKGIEPDYQVALPAYADLPYIDPAKELKVETFATEIKAAQGYLLALGYQPGREDGYFDQQTKEAVLAFQKMENLPANGVIGGKTTSRMIELVRKKIEQNDTQMDMAQQVLRKMLP